MCYAIPAKIVNIVGENATLDYGGITKTANISLLADAVIGDFVLVHAGFAIEKLDKKTAEEALKIIEAQIARQEEKWDN